LFAEKRLLHDLFVAAFRQQLSFGSSPSQKTAFINSVALWVGGLYALWRIISNDIAAAVAVQTILQTPSPHYATA
jgi:hypothetical protein